MVDKKEQEISANFFFLPSARKRLQNENKSLANNWILLPNNLN